MRIIIVATTANIEVIVEVVLVYLFGFETLLLVVVDYCIVVNSYLYIYLLSKININ